MKDAGMHRGADPTARAAPYEKGTETPLSFDQRNERCGPRARPPMRRGLKHLLKARHLLLGHHRARGPL